MVWAEAAGRVCPGNLLPAQVLVLQEGLPSPLFIKRATGDARQVQMVQVLGLLVGKVEEVVVWALDIRA
jgi:hypothetical protein